MEANKEIELTLPQFRALIEAWECRKLWAIIVLWHMLGCPTKPATKPEIREMYERLIFGNLADWQKQSIVLWLDICAPPWRKAAPETLVGPFIERTDPAVRQWRMAVLSRDGFKCAGCGATDHLEAHHIVSWKHARYLRVTLGNGVTLCTDCHDIADHMKFNCSSPLPSLRTMELNTRIYAL